MQQKETESGAVNSATFVLLSEEASSPVADHLSQKMAEKDGGVESASAAAAQGEELEMDPPLGTLKTTELRSRGRRR